MSSQVNVRALVATSIGITITTYLPNLFWEGMCCRTFRTGPSSPASIPLGPQRGGTQSYERALTIS